MTQDIIDFCKTNRITVDQFYGKEIIDLSLDWRHLTSIPDGFNPNINGFLGLDNVKLLPDNFTPTIESGLLLDSLSSIPKNFNPKIGGQLYINAKIAEEILINYNYNIWCYVNYDINIISDYMHNHKLNYYEAGIKLQRKINLNKLPILKTYIKALNRDKIIDNILK
jgi:hypothetical protein